MDVQPIDQGAVLRSGFATVPNYMEDQLRQQLAGAQVQQAQTEAARVAAAGAHEQREAAEQAAFQADVGNLGQSPTAADYARLMIRHPQMSEAVNRGFQALDNDQRQQTFQSLANITAAARGGHYDIAAQQLRARDAADTAAGHPPDPLHASIQAALESGDPQQQAMARDLLERVTASIAGPEHYASTYGSFQRDLAEVDGVLYDKHTGEAVAQSPYDLVRLGPDGSSVTQHRVPGIPVLGGANGAPVMGAPPTAAGDRQDGGGFDFQAHPTTPVPAVPQRPRTGANAHPVADAGSIVSAIYPHARVTSTRRDPNSALGRANPRSWHNTTGAAVDVAPIPGMTFNQYIAGIRGRGYQIIEARDEVAHPAHDTTGPNWHVVIGRSQPTAGTIPRINTAQQYAALPSGAEFVDPQGVHRTKQ